MPEVTPCSEWGGRRKAEIGVCRVASADRWGGVEAQLASILKALARRKELRLSAILFNDGRLGEEIRQAGVEVKIISESSKNFLQMVLEARRYLEGRGVGILHSHGYKAHLLSALVAGRCDIPVVVRSHHGLPEPFAGFKHYKQRMVQMVDRVVARYATKCMITVSSDLRNHLTQYVDLRKTVVIPNGLDTEQVKTTLKVSEAKERLGIPQDCLVLGTAGRLEPIKRLDLFLRAAKQIAIRLPNTRFVIVGEGSEQARLRDYVRANGLQDRVCFLGHRSDIYDVLRALDVLVFSSDHEGLPNVLLEALHLGVVVVARRVGGIPEVIQDGTSGLLVESSEPAALAEACLQILADEGRRKRLALGGANRVADKFAVERVAAEVTKLYCSLYESNGRMNERLLGRAE